MAKRKKNKGQNPDVPEQGAKNKGAKGNSESKDGAAKQNAGKSPWERGKARQEEASGTGGAGTKATASTGGRAQSRQEKRSKNNKSAQAKPAKQAKQARPRIASRSELKEDYIFSMSRAPRLDENTPMHWIQFIPAILFSAVVIMLVRQYGYARDMSQYYWSAESTPPAAGVNNLVEFFSHYKVEMIGWSILFMGLMLAYRVIVQQFAVKRSHYYWPMLGYILFVLLSFFFASDRDVAWNGWNDRFEGTAVILCYFIAVFFIMNSVNSERNIKFILYPIAAVTVVLSALGLTQATGHDFFQSTLGQKLIVPNKMNVDGDYMWDLIDQAAAQGEQYLKFTFQNNEIYQTVYNINYVSFYLTLLMPVFAMLFIWSKGPVRKAIWGVIFGLTVFNFFGAASSGGMLGMGIVLVFVVLILRKKLLQWWRPLLVILVIVVAVGALDIALVNHNGKGVKWTDELRFSIGVTLASGQEETDSLVRGPGNTEGAQDTEVSGAATAEVPDEPSKPLSHLDWLSNKDNSLTFSVDGNEATMSEFEDGSIKVLDNQGAELDLTQTEGSQEVLINDSRFANVYFQAQTDEDGTQFLALRIRGEEVRSWPFILGGEDRSTLLFRNDLKKDLALENIPHIGFENNPGFGNGRGYIWSASLPLIKDTFIIGHGADTYCIEFPHKDYVGKYNAGWNVNMIVDKPHNMYIATAINTGVTSLIALFVLFLMYIVQSVRLYWRREFTTFAEYAGAGIFFGISGFIVSGFVDDSTVSVMPMFYGLLATGIAINMMLRKRYGDEKKTESKGGEAEGGKEAA
ncbi:MAG: O-antigen ligase family protein [Clostridiales Family XIII bacterium]|jgi:hypothetical protein|nr:O-antigen ligase family protein [Clostridiales Family XIII bacterium]